MQSEHVLANNEAKQNIEAKSAHSTLAWVVVLTASLYFFYEFIQMNIFNAINVPLRETYQLNAEQLGQLFAMYFYGNALCIFPVGNIIDRFSTRRLLLFAITVSTLSTLVFSLAQSYYVAAFARFLVGCGASFCFLSCIRIASRWFPPKRMALVTGIVVTMAMLGGLMAQTPFTLLVEYLGDWRQALLVDVFLGVVIFVAIYFLVQDRPPHSQEHAKTDQQQLKELGIWRCIKLAISNPQNWLGGFYTSLVNLPVFILGGLWGIRYLVDVHHVTMAEASYATTLFFVGVIVGSIVYGWISDHIERRVFPMVIGAVLSLAVVLMLMYAAAPSLLTLIALFFLIGLVTSSQVLTYPLIAESNPSYLTSTCVSIDSICIMISGFIFPPFFGWLMERVGSQVEVNGVLSYTAEQFNHALLVFPVAFVIALLLAFLMRETHCKPMK